MIHWLVENMADHPDIARGVCPDDLLNAAELRQLCDLSIPKRRREWLLGRWTAKRLLQAVLENPSGERIPLEDLTIINTPSGAPVVTGAWFKRVSLSISHRGENAFCAALVHDLTQPEERCGLGADIELVEPRTATFAEDYFTRPEYECVLRSSEALRDLRVTAIWSAKEAALKAAHLGLNVDTRAVTCWIDAAAEPPREWTRFQITWDAHRLAESALDSAPPRVRLEAARRLGSQAALPAQGWWCVRDDLVLTLAARPEADAVPAPAPAIFTGVLA